MSGDWLALFSVESLILDSNNMAWIVVTSGGHPWAYKSIYKIDLGPT
jgi:hypothetical protein